MYELIRITENDFYIQCPAKIGLVKTGENEACLIDSGGDKDAGKKCRRILDAEGLRLRAIYNTHSHADHVGGNAYLQAQTGCRVFAAGIERVFTERPYLEPAFLYGGDPPPGLRHKFLMAQPSAAEALTERMLPEGWRLIPLPGHSFDMVGFRTPDNTVFLGDCLASETTLKKYGIPFLVDPAAYLGTLELVKTLEARCFVPAHAEETETIAPLAQKNIDATYEAAARIEKICETPTAFEEILKSVFDAYGLIMSLEQYALVGSTVRSYLSWLSQEGRLRAEIDGNRLYWRK